MIEITLPWPPKELSPNARVHWSVRSKAVKAARQAGFIGCKQAQEGSKFKFEYIDGKVHLWIDFHPPSNRRIDDDNCLSRFKSMRDGIADYLGVDDRIFVSHPFVKDKVPGGCVKVRITAGPENKAEL
ncbi:MAG: hypothetical protein ACXV8O_01260 [Methylobacter sp.]